MGLWLSGALLSLLRSSRGNRMRTGGSWGRTGLPPAIASTIVNANNQMTTFGGTTLTYDLNGNLTTAADSFGTATYTWDVRNRLTGLTSPGFSASFAYDSMGRRTGKTVQGVTTNFVYDGVNPVQEKNGATVTANILTGLGIDEVFTRTDGTGTRALATEALGSTVAVTDNTGTLQTQYTYEPFGFTTSSGQASTNSYKYTGREDDGTGLFYYRARYYSPRLQRFVSEDPIEFAGGDVNLYAYVFANPLIFRDPFGLYGEMVDVFSPTTGNYPAAASQTPYLVHQSVARNGPMTSADVQALTNLAARTAQIAAGVAVVATAAPLVTTAVPTMATYVAARSVLSQLEALETVARLAMSLAVKGTLAYMAITNFPNTSTNVMNPRRSSK